jgi:type IV secretion system protein VirD4
LAKRKKVQDGLLLGWSHPYSSPRPRIGFNNGHSPSAPQDHEPIFFNREGHLITIAPTGAGKGVSCIIPALLTYTGPVIVIDPKGEAYHVTARRRHELGQKVIRLDPFGVIDTSTDALNPLDLLVDVEGLHYEDEARALTDLLAGGHQSLRDAFWDNTSQAFISGLLMYLATSVMGRDRRLSKLREFFGSRSLPMVIAKLLDTNCIQSEDAKQEFAIFLQHPERDTRPSIQSTAGQHLRLFGSLSVRRATDCSTFALQDVIDGKPLSIYIIIPPNKLESHRGLLRLWLGVLLMALTMRRKPPPQRTLLIVDEAAQLGSLAILRQAVTLYRGYGVQAWIFVQDVSQLKYLYPDSWPAIVNNCAVVQLFGPRNQRMAKEFAELIGGISSRAVMRMEENQQVMLVNGSGPLLSVRPNYLTDAMFRGRFDDNPMYDPVREAGGRFR